MSEFLTIVVGIIILMLAFGAGFLVGFRIGYRAGKEFMQFLIEHSTAACVAVNSDAK